MKLDLSKDHRITLKRHGKKLWSYRDQKPDVVEAAVLDYLRDHDFDGYFTQRDNYLSLFMTLAGWPGKITKRMPPWFVSPWSIYLNGADGWLQNHNYTFSQVMSEAKNTNFDTLLRKIQLFCEGKTDSPFYFSGSMRQPDHTIEFLKAFGIERLKEAIVDEFNVEVWGSHKFLYDFDIDLLRRKLEWDTMLSPEGLELGLKPAYLHSAAFWINDNFKNNIDRTEEFAQHVKDSAVKVEILDACALARRWRDKTVARYDFATLDRPMWDETGTADVEVKAPNDKLSQAQKNTINRARTRGERACVIYVSEANQPH